MAKTLQEYLALPYTITIRKDPRDEIYVARISELPGCSAHGASDTEALERIRESLSVWIEDALEAGDEIPVPDEISALPSGKWLQRVPRSLHSKLIKLARKEGVSLNQLVVMALAELVGAGILPTGEIAEPTTISSSSHMRVVLNQYSGTVHGNRLFFREELSYSDPFPASAENYGRKGLEAELLIEALASQMPSSGKFNSVENTSSARQKNTQFAYQA
jgi:antitoxin HicB